MHIIVTKWKMFQFCREINFLQSEKCNVNQSLKQLFFCGSWQIDTKFYIKEQLVKSSEDILGREKKNVI